jgi:TM2 domain-containing membrane protein YozV
MTITPTTLTRGAAVAAVGAGLLFIGVQIGHPHFDATTVASNEVVVRDSLKTLMAVLGLVGVTGIYLSQVRRNGVLGLVGFLVLGACYLLMACMTYMATFVLPQLVTTDPAFVDDVITQIKGGTPNGDIGPLALVLQVQSVTFLAGGLIFGIALFRAGILARWATVLLAAGGVITILLSLMPDAFYRLLAFPNGIAMIGLGYSLWATSRAADTHTTSLPDAAEGPRVAAAGAA